MAGYDEQALIAEATAIIGTDEPVLAAGVFGLSELSAGQVAGGTAGAVGGGLVGGGLLAAIGSIIGSTAGTQAAAAAAGVSVQLLVAITADRIHVLDRDAAAGTPEAATFDRAAVVATVEPLGASRRLTLTDPSSGEQLHLHGSVGWISAQAAGDTVVLGLLTS